MSATAVITLRVPNEVKRRMDSLAARFGHKPAQLGARLIEEGLRRRDFPQIDLRETAAGRVAYLGGTRLAVYWVAGLVPEQLTAEQFAREYDLPLARIRAALAYAQAFPEEIQSDRAHAQDNRKWIQQQDAAWRAGRWAEGSSKPKSKAKR